MSNNDETKKILQDIDYKIKWLVERCDRLERIIIKNEFDIKQLQKGEDQ